MAYFMQVKDNQGEYKSLNVSKSSKFEHDNISKSYVKTVAYSLQSLNRFTMQFADEKELRNHLLLERILPVNLADRPLVIRFATKKKARNYSLLFIDDLEYFYTNNLFKSIENRYLNNDFKFLVEFAQYFRNFKECGATAGDLLALSNMALTTGRIDKGFEKTDSNGDNPVMRLTKLLIYKYKTLPGNKVEYNQNEFNWRTLHILIEFIKDYEQKEITKKKMSAIKANSDKRKILKKEEIPTNKEVPGQLNLRDLL